MICYQKYISGNFFLFKKILNVYLLLRERERERETVRVGGGAEREGDRERQNRKQAPGSELSAQSLMWGWKSQTVRSRPEPKLDA